MTLIKTKPSQIWPTNQSKTKHKNKPPKPEEKHSNKGEDEDGWGRISYFAAEYLPVEQDSPGSLL